MTPRKPHDEASPVPTSGRSDGHWQFSIAGGFACRGAISKLDDLLVRRAHLRRRRLGPPGLGGGRPSARAVHTPSRLRRAAAVWALATALLAAGAAGQEVDVAYGYLSGDFGTAAPGEVQQVSLSLAWGRSARFRVVVPGVYGSVPRTVIRTRLGEVPLERLRAAQDSGRLPPGVAATETTSEAGLGDVRLGLALPLAGGGARRFRLEGEAEVKAPTADEERNLGSGEWDGRAGLAAEYALWSATLFGGVGFNRLGDPPGLELEDVPDAYFGAESEPSAWGLRYAAWLEGHPEVVRGRGARVVAAAGLGRSARGSWRLVLRAGLTEAAEDFGVELGFSLRPSSLRRRGRP